MNKNIDLDNILKNAKLKSTKAKLAVLEHIIKASAPESVDQIYSAVKKTCDYSTVFRSLIAFEKAGLAKKVLIKGKSTFYEADIDKHHHHHLVCEDCGKIEELDICIKDIEKKTLDISKMFRTITNHSVEFYGKCKNCA